MPAAAFPLSNYLPRTSLAAMNVFVTGGAGYIGSICSEALLDAGHRVTVYDNLSEGHRSAVDARARFVLGRPEEDNDILNAVKEAKPDAIMHFAANALVGESMVEPGEVLPQQRRQRPEAARCRGRMRREEVCVQLDLRHLRPA